MQDIPTSIEIEEIENHEDIIDLCYEIFKDCVLSKKNRPKLFEFEVIVPVEPWIEYKAQAFWHIVSLSEKDKSAILPCINDPSISKCDENCINHKYTVRLSNGESRDVCYYRATKAYWIQSIIRLANANDKNLKYWYKKDNKKKRRELYLRYQNKHIDYVVVLEDKNSKKFVLITAYPVFYTNSKKGFDKDYQSYLKENQK